MHFLDVKWWFSLRDELDKHGKKRKIFKGEPVVEKTTPIYRHHLLVICRSFLKMGNISGVHKLSAIVTAFLGVGRSGEWSLCSYKGSKWDHALDSFTMDWNQKKTAKQSPMNFFPDKEHYEMDFYTALGYLALVSNGNASPTGSENASMFPFIQQNDLEHFGAARVMTNYLRSSLVHDSNKELWKDICGTGLRKIYNVRQGIKHRRGQPARWMVFHRYYEGL